MKRYRVDVIVENQEYKSWMTEDYAKIVLGGIFVAENDCSEDEIYCQVKKWILANIDLSKVQSPQMQFHIRVNNRYNDFYIFENSINQLNIETMKEGTKNEIKKAVKAVGKYVGLLLRMALVLPVIMLFNVVLTTILIIARSVLAFLYAIVGDAETAADTVRELDINI